MTQPYPFPVEDVDPDAGRAPDPERDDAIAGSTVDGTTDSAAADREASYDDRGSGSRVADADGTYADDTLAGGIAGSSGEAASSGGADDSATPEVITVDQSDRAAGQV